MTAISPAATHWANRWKEVPALRGKDLEGIVILG
jgi:hypothetical protein